MIYTAGMILINNKNELLIVHSTNASQKNWSIPKGIIENNESTIEAAKRELYEETNIVLDKYKPVYMLRGDNVIYNNKKKTLCPVYVKLFDEIIGLELRCNSIVEIKNKKSFPENDKIIWSEMSKAMDLIHSTQVIAIRNMIIR